MAQRKMVTVRFLPDHYARLKAAVAYVNAEQHPDGKISMNKVCVNKAMDWVMEIEHQLKSLDAQQYGGDR